MNESSTERRSCYKLTPLENRTLRGIFRAILTSGEAPAVDELGKVLKASDEEIIRVLDGLEKMDLLLRKKGTQQIISIYPFSLVPTRHQTILEDGKKLFAMCAVDALGMPNMFDQAVKIVSQCDWCKSEITLDIRDGQVVTRSHPDIQIWNVEKPGEGPDAEICCPVISFFCSAGHFGNWKNENSDLARRGRGEPLKQAYPDIRKRWRRYGEAIGVR
jgi:hypothetical protein